MQKRLGLLPWQEWWAAPEPVPAVSPVVTIIYLGVTQLKGYTEGEQDNYEQHLESHSS
jgi:hypothetical protein